MADHLHSLISSLPVEDQADLASYMAASSEMDRREAEYLAALPGRMAGIADDLSDLLPDGLRFEWGQPVPDDQHARFARGGVIRAPGGEDGILARRLPGEQFFTRKQVEALAAEANVTLVDARTEADDA